MIVGAKGTYQFDVDLDNGNPSANVQFFHPGFKSL
jgi:hypothetical protein